MYFHVSPLCSLHCCSWPNSAFISRPPRSSAPTSSLSIYCSPATSPMMTATSSDAPSAILPIPNRTKPITGPMCDSIYWNLIEMHNGARHKDASEACSVLRELWQTERCDIIGTDFSGHRKAISEHVGDDVKNRILQYTASESDRERAIDTIGHYHMYSRKLLVAALPLSSRLYYHTIYQAERSVAVVTGMATVGGLGRWFYRQHQLRKLSKK